MSSKQHATSKKLASRSPKIEKNVTTLSGFVCRSCLGNNFFVVGPPPVGNSDLVGFGPILGRRYLEKFRYRAKNRKTQFPGARGPETEKKKYHDVQDGCAHYSHVLSFD